MRCRSSGHTPCGKCRLKTSNNKSRGWPPELDRFLTAKDARAAARAWSKEQFRSLSFWVGLIGYTVLVGLAVAGVLVLIRHWILFPRSWFGGIVGGVTGGTGVAAMTWYWRHRYRRFLRARLNAAGIPICMKCGYDLTGNESGVCPECGTRSGKGAF